MKRCTSLLLAAGTALAVTAANAEVPKAKWIAQCVSVLSKDNSERSKRVYCACMQEAVGDVEDKYSYDLERTFPPVHQSCYKKAGFKPPR